MTEQLLGTCAACGLKFPYDVLDTKPVSNRYKRDCEELGQLKALDNALWRDDDFTRMECEKCYGPGYVSTQW